MTKLEPIEAHIVVHAIAERDGKILLVEEKNNTWSIPTGSVEPGETIVEAIKREVEEETGVKCNPVGIFKIIHSEVLGKFFNSSKETVLRIYYFFKIEILDTPSSEETNHTLSSGWFTPSEIEKMQIRTRNLLAHIVTYYDAMEKNSILSIDYLN